MFGRAGVREVDRRCVEEFGLPGIALMENASRALAAHALTMLASAPSAGGPTLILCGPGANGGDGFAGARHLHNAGVPVALACTQSPAAYRSDAAVNLFVAQRMGLPIGLINGGRPARSLDSIVARIGPPALLIDCLLGTGLDRPLAEPFTSVVRWINARRAAGAAVLACDIPTGLDCDTGRPLGADADACVLADATVTFCGLKRGFLAPGASAYTGAVTVGDIGAPRALLESLALQG